MVVRMHDMLHEKKIHVQLDIKEMLTMHMLVGGLLFLGNKGLILPRLKQTSYSQNRRKPIDSNCCHSIGTVLTAFAGR
jgi:hypothetical protein